LVPTSKAYNVEVAHKYNMMQIKLTEFKIPRVTKYQFFCLSDSFCTVRLLHKYDATNDVQNVHNLTIVTPVDGRPNMSL